MQSPEADVAFIGQVFRTRVKRSAKTLCEDFCGSAALSAAWVRSARDRRAVGVDLDPRPLEYARRVHRAVLGDDAARFVLRRANVLEGANVLGRAARGGYDVIAAYNFSVFELKRRRDLLAYFRAAHARLNAGGLFFMDAFGGITAQSVSLEPRESDGVTYIWEQASFDPLTSTLRAYIHFRLPNGRMIERAFRYDWRLWQLVELTEALEEAGFAARDVYWEDRDADGEPTGRFRRRTKVEAEPSWTAYVIAQRALRTRARRSRSARARSP